MQYIFIGLLILIVIILISGINTNAKNIENIFGVHNISTIGCPVFNCSFEFSCITLKNIIKHTSVI